MNNTIIEKALTVEANGSRIPAMLTLPASGKAEWAVVFVPGSFLNDIDGNYLAEGGNPFVAKPHVYKDLAEGLARNGVAALRHARAGVTVVDPEAAAAHRHFADRTTVVAEAVRAVREATPGIKRCALAGHSEGGPVCLLLLSQSPGIRVDAYISLSAPARRFFDIMLQQTEASVKDGMASFGPVKFPFAPYREAMDHVRKGRPVPPELFKQLPPFGVHAMDELSKRYLREYDEVDPLALIGRLKLPVLVVQGGEDTSVFPDNADLLMAARKGNPAPTDKAFFPGLQHFYKPVPPGLDPMALFGLETESDPRVAAAIAAWLVKIGR
jgi:pimeloyl-ACP methyl ester carboxylesterase